MNKYIIKQCCHEYNKYLYYLIYLKRNDNIIHNTYKLFNYAIVNNIDHFVDIIDYILPYRYDECIIYFIPNARFTIFIYDGGYYRYNYNMNNKKFISVEECYKLMI